MRSRVCSGRKQIMLILMTLVVTIIANGMVWGAPINLTIVGPGGAQAIDARKVTLERFMRENPDINVEYIPTTGDILQKVEVMIAGGVAPDILFIGNGAYQSFADRNLILPLDDLIARDKLNLRDVIPGALAMYQYKGKQWGFPIDFPNQGLFYNVDMFNEAGLRQPSPDWKDASWNWQSFLDVAKKLARDLNGDGKKDTWAYRVQTGFRPWWVWVAANGGDVYNADGTQLALQQQPAVEAFQFLADLVNVHQVAYLGGDGPFINGRAAMDTRAPNIGGMQQNLSKFEWNVVPHPGGKAGKAAAGGGTGHFISSQTKHPEAAWRLLKYLISKDFIYEWTKILRFVPPLRSVAHSDAFIVPGMPPANIMVLVEGSEYLRPDPPHPKFIQTTQIVIPLLNEVLANKMPARTAMEMAAEQAKPILAQ